MLDAIESYEERVKIIISFIAGVFFMVLSHLGQLFSQNSTAPDYKKLSRPQLEPELVAECPSVNKFTYKYQIENKGKYPAENILYLSKTNEFRILEYEAAYNRELLSGGKHVFKPNRFSESIENNKEHIFELIALYSSNILGKELYFKDAYTFVLKASEMNGKPISYMYSSHQESPMSKNDKAKYIDVEKDMDSKEGTVAFSFAISEQHELLSVIMVKSKTKTVIYDPKRKSIIFINKVNQLVFAMEKKINEEMEGIHKVGISWSPDTMRLAVDGELAKRDINASV